MLLEFQNNGKVEERHILGGRFSFWAGFCPIGRPLRGSPPKGPLIFGGHISVGMGCYNVVVISAAQVMVQAL